MRIPFSSGRAEAPAPKSEASAAGPTRFLAARETRIGGRSSNQDAEGATLADGMHFWAVADGLGAHRGGAAAARLVVDTVLAELAAMPAMDVATLEGVVETARSALVRERASTDGGLTTLVLLASDGTAARWVHVGDSRLYFFRQGRVALRTRDHSVPEMLFRAGEIQEDEIRGHRDRNRLLRALGPGGDGRPAVSEAITLASGDAFLLCTDGWWETLADSEVIRLLAAAATPAEWLGSMTEAIESRRPADNFTAIAIFVL